MMLYDAFWCFFDIFYASLCFFMLPYAFSCIFDAFLLLFLCLWSIFEFLQYIQKLFLICKIKQDFNSCQTWFKAFTSLPAIFFVSFFKLHTYFKLAELRNWNFPSLLPSPIFHANFFPFFRKLHWLIITCETFFFETKQTKFRCIINSHFWKVAVAKLFYGKYQTSCDLSKLLPTTYVGI